MGKEHESLVQKLRNRTAKKEGKHTAEVVIVVIVSS